ncbi:hypothetical protein [Seohaeicola zhoushanensis]|uniref:Uncharacterized protein n=1 Tax=Seohaeicola zhoushanensis TaxID=1569283 RepID=A0A8J3M339_9RHOB|nr:hypothetical protein [Seohaeicola zhoushanensis]GHF33118.1 hypothetical protein GCM10017056_00650 [Seohaeicola zhoushanensis]
MTNGPTIQTLTPAQREGYELACDTLALWAAQLGCNGMKGATIAGYIAELMRAAATPHSRTGAAAGCISVRP